MTTQVATHLATPFDALRWNAQQLADAVPLRLHQVLRFDIGADARSANTPISHAPIGHAQHDGYLASEAAPPLFRVR